MTLIGLVGGVQLPVSRSMPKNIRTGSYTIVAGDQSKIVEFTGAAASTITLPNAAAVGSGWWCYLKHSGTGTTAAAKRLAINGTLDGVVNTAVYPGDTRIIQSNGTSLTSVLLVGGFLAVEASDSPFTYTVPSGTVTHQAFVLGGAGAGGYAGRAERALCRDAVQRLARGDDRGGACERGGVQ